MWESENWRNVYSIHDKVNELIKNVTEWSIYIRMDRRFRCITCYDPSTDETKGYCSECLGTGWKISVEIIPARFTNDMTNMEGEFDQDMGRIPINYTKLHVPREVYPKPDDLVLQVSWDVDMKHFEKAQNPQVIDIFKKFNIVEVNRPVQTEVSWFTANLMQDSQNVSKILEDIGTFDLERFKFE